METQMEHFAWTRKNILSLLRSTTPEEAFRIPARFNNNLVWNAGHVIYVQQILVYHLAGLPTFLPDGFEQQYASGTKPSPSPDKKGTVEELTGLLERGVEQTLADYREGKFIQYRSLRANYDTVPYHLTDWEQAFQYNNIHEARHYGFMLGIKQGLAETEPAA